MAASGASGTNTKEYRAIKRHCDTITDNLGSTVGDPARFAGRLREKSLISDGECLCSYAQWVVTPIHSAATGVTKWSQRH